MHFYQWSLDYDHDLINSIAPGRQDCNPKLAIQNIKISWAFPAKLPSTDDQSVSVQAMAWCHQAPKRRILQETLVAITWINVDLSSQGFCDVHLRRISPKVLMNLIRNMSHKVTPSKLLPYLSGTCELKSKLSKKEFWSVLSPLMTYRWPQKQAVSGPIILQSMPVELLKLVNRRLASRYKKTQYSVITQPIFFKILIMDSSASIPSPSMENEFDDFKSEQPSSTSTNLALHLKCDKNIVREIDPWGADSIWPKTSYKSKDLVTSRRHKINVSSFLIALK